MAVIYITEADNTQHKFRLPMDMNMAVTIGRNEDCLISLPGVLGLSGLHCSITFTGNEYVITDLGSSNGTIVGTRPISSEVLCEGVGYRIGTAMLYYEAEAAAPSPYGAPAASPYGAPAPSPYGAPAPSPYGTPAPSPYGVPAPSPYGAPASSPYGAPAASPYGAPAASPSPYGAPAPAPAPAPRPTHEAPRVASLMPSAPAPEPVPSAPIPTPVVPVPVPPAEEPEEEALAEPIPVSEYADYAAPAEQPEPAAEEPAPAPVPTPAPAKEELPTADDDEPEDDEEPEDDDEPVDDEEDEEEEERPRRVRAKRKMAFDTSTLTRPEELLSMGNIICMLIAFALGFWLGMSLNGPDEPEQEPAAESAPAEN